MRAFNVYLDGEQIDTIYYDDNTTLTEDDVRDSLVFHDGYNYNIIVEEDLN